jgi:hypothetical protein
MKRIYTLILLLSAMVVNTFAQGNVGIGTNNPVNSAALDITASDKGLLIPRVSLSSAITFGLTGTATAGMLVFNTNAGMTLGMGVGFYYWNGALWAKIIENTSVTLTNGTILIGNASNIPVERTISGDATVTNTGVLTIANDAITTAKIANNAVDGTKINLTGNANGDLMYYNGTDWVRLASGTTGQMLQTNGAGAPTWVSKTAILNSQNGLSTVTSGGSATATTPYVELGGALYKATNISGIDATNKLTFTATGTDAINFDNNTLSIDATNDRVGIGTTAPKSKLDVSGNVTIGSTYSGANAAPTNGAIIQGQVGIGNNSPNTNAILDLTNSSGASSTALAIQLPSAPNSALAGSPTPPNINNSAVTNGATTNGGLMVYNQTTGCLQYYNAILKQWLDVATSATASNTIATPSISGCTIVGAREQGVTYSITSPVAGASYNWIVSGSNAYIVSGQGTSSITVSWSTSNKIGGQTKTTDALSTPYETTISVTGTKCGANGGGSAIVVNAGGRQVFQCQNSTGASDQTFTVPSNSCIALHKVMLWAAGGGCGGSSGKRGSGGAGGFVCGCINLPIGSYGVMAGQGGYKANTTVEYGGAGVDAGGNSAGSGGGRAAIRNGSADLVTAGGGGGGAYSNNHKCYGGAGGGSTGGSGGKDNTSTIIATGGGQSSGGTRGYYNNNYYGVTGSQYQGGNGNGSNWDGGGGGGGYYGGGGGGGYYGGGGGGGSSYVANLVTGLDVPTIINDQGNADTGAGGGDIAPSANAISATYGYTIWGTNSGSSYNAVGYGGGASNGHDGGPALIIIEW